MHNTLILLTILISLMATSPVSADYSENSNKTSWETVFFDDFDTFNEENWQDQILWVNNEKQCYVPDNEYETREVSDGTLKIKVVNIGEHVNVKKFQYLLVNHRKRHLDCFIDCENITLVSLEF